MSDSASSSAVELVRRGVIATRQGPAAAIAASRADVRVVGRQPVPARSAGGRSVEAGRQGRVVARPGHRQQVALDGPADRARGGTRSPRRARRGSRARAPRPGRPSGPRRGRRRRARPADRARRRSARLGLEARRRLAPAGPAAAAARRREQPQDAPALQRCGRPAARRRARRASPVSDAVGSSRRAASSSSATSGLPARTARPRAAAGWPTRARPRSPR